MTGWRAVVWDGLSVTVPTDWEPARLGLGYLFLEDSSGPRLSLRWQRLPKPVGPEKVLGRLSRRTCLKPDTEPAGVVAAMLSALPEGRGGLACAEAKGRGAGAVLFTLPGLAVLAAPHARPGEPAQAWAEAAGSLEAAPSGAFALYDVAGHAPDGFTLAAFKMELGHYHLHYRSRRGVLDFHRFAPSEAILRGRALEDWCGQALACRGERQTAFKPGYFQGFPGADHADQPGVGVLAGLRGLAALVFDRARYARCQAWKPDRSRILAVSARHGGELAAQHFEEVCRRYVVLAP